MFIKIKALESMREGVGFEDEFEEMLLNTDAIICIQSLPQKKAYVLLTSEGFYSVLAKDAKKIFEAIGVSL